MNEIELTQLFLEYRQTSDRLLEIENKIRENVLKLETTQKIAGVSATYYKPSTRYDYESAALLKIADWSENDREGMIEKHSSKKVTTKWKDLVEELEIPLEQVPQELVEARVVLKI